MRSPVRTQLGTQPRTDVCATETRTLHALLQGTPPRHPASSSNTNHRMRDRVERDCPKQARSGLEPEYAYQSDLAVDDAPSLDHPTIAAVVNVRGRAPMFVVLCTFSARRRAALSATGTPTCGPPGSGRPMGRSAPPTAVASGGRTPHTLTTSRTLGDEIRRRGRSAAAGPSSLARIADRCPARHERSAPDGQHQKADRPELNQEENAPP